MKSNKRSARRLLIETVETQVLPALEKRDFKKIIAFQESRPNWSYHRSRKSGGYDLLSISFDAKHRPEFYALINTVEPKGIHQPWGEYVRADEATAFHPLRRILLLKKNAGPLAFILPYWFSHIWWGIKPKQSTESNSAAALHVCGEFLACLEQAEKWWTTGELGKNLVVSDLTSALVKPSKEVTFPT